MKNIRNPVFVIALAVTAVCLADEPIDIGDRLQVLWDDYIVDPTKTTASRLLHHPQYAGKAFDVDAPWERGGATYFHVVRTDEPGVKPYRMYYLGIGKDPKSVYGMKSRNVCFMESDNGLVWTRPVLGLVAFEGSKENNILMNESTNEGLLDNFFVFRDENPDCMPDERYKAVANYEVKLNPDGTVKSEGCARHGLQCYVSADGVRFRPNGYLMRDGLFDSLNIAFWHAPSGEYRLYFRGGHSNFCDRNRNVWLRDVRYASSKDFRNWSRPQLIDFGRGAADYALYTSVVQPYFRAPEVCIGFPTRYVEREKWTENYGKLPSLERRKVRMARENGGAPRYGLVTTDNVFMMTRDGLHFQRDDEAFLRPGPEHPENWMYGDGYAAHGFVLSPGRFGGDDELSMFYHASGCFVSPERRCVNRYTIRQDGFVSRHSTYAEQKVVTRELVFHGSKMYLNFSTSARGYVYVTIRDRIGSALGSIELFGDKVDREVDFEYGLSVGRFADRPVTIEFRMSDADIWSFRFGGERNPELPPTWRLNLLGESPVYRECPFTDSHAAGMKALMVDGFGPGGTAAAFFCYYAVPEGERPKDGFPAVLLVHGGGGTAYPNYVDLWRKKGFAVLAPDWRNCRPAASANPNCLTEEMCPPKVSLPLEGGARTDIEANVANLALANSLLRSMPEVDTNKTVYVGLSWGSWYGTALAAFDDRFNGFVEIYCGDRDLSRNLLVDGRFLPQAKKPMWWIVGTNDKNVTPETSQAGFDACPKFAGCAIVPELPHSHVGFRFDSVARMAGHFARGEAGLPRLGKIRMDGNWAVADIISPGKGIGHAVLSYTIDGQGKASWQRKWQTLPAAVEDGCVCADVPKGAKAFFLSLYEMEEGVYHDMCGSSGYCFR